jgi:hypothetical protein
MRSHNQLESRIDGARSQVQQTKPVYAVSSHMISRAAPVDRELLITVGEVGEDVGLRQQVERHVHLGQPID